MAAKPAVYVLGCGGHAKVVVQTLRALGYGVEAVFDDNTQKCGGKLLGIPIVGPTARMADLQSVPVVIAIGDNATREMLATRYDADWLTIVHPFCYVDPSAVLGRGTVVFAGAVIQAESRIGAHVIVNTSASVDHDCVIGDFVHIAPGAHLAGGVRIGAGSLIGIGAVVLPQRRVGDRCVVGAGAVVTRDLPSGVTVKGVPARMLPRGFSDA